MNNNWDRFIALLQEMFYPINTGENSLSPEELWERWSDRLEDLARDPVIADKLVSMGNGIRSPIPYEATRILSNLRQRRMINNLPNEGRRLVERMRVEVLPRSRPIRNIPRETLSGDLLDVATIGNKLSYSQFQIEGWTTTSQALENQEGLVVVAPTGAGKTEVFLLPLITRIARALRNDPSSAPHYVLVYPRVPLLKDQLARIFEYSFRASQRFPSGQTDWTRPHVGQPIVIGLQFGGIRSTRNDTFNNAEVFNGRQFLPVTVCPICHNGTLQRQNAIDNVVPLRCDNSECSVIFHVTLGRNELEDTKPHILVTTLESLDRLYLNPKIETYLQNLDGIVFDEVHLYYSLYGSHVSNVLQRIERIQNRGQRLTKIASSATISYPERFAAKLFYMDENRDVPIHDAANYPSETSGLETILFLRSPEGTEPPPPPPQATLIQAAMATTHGILSPSDRAILFTDSVDHVNRTRRELDDAENTQHLYQFRTFVDAIYFQNVGCPRTSPGSCITYVVGECWRGILGGERCVTFNNLRIAPAHIGAISSYNPSDIAQGDIVVATASLEVGVDDENFRATIHYRPPLNVFSFIQRRGRAGRRQDDIAYTLMILGNESDDEFYFRRRNRLIDGGRYELPLNPNNPVVREMHAQLERERASLELIRQRHRSIPKAILIWTLDKYLQCPTLQHHFSQELANLRQVTLSSSRVDASERGFRRWVDTQYTNFKDLLDQDVALQELEARAPADQRASVAELRDRIRRFRADNPQEANEIEDLARRLVQAISVLRVDRSLSDAEREEYGWITDRIIQIHLRYSQRVNLEVGYEEVSSLYQFFSVLHEALNGTYGNSTLKYAPQAIVMVMQSLFYTGITCLGSNQCNTCLPFHVPSAYFQEVKPILVQTIRSISNRGDEISTIEVEDSTRLASMLIPYKPFYRYYAGHAMAVLITEHHQDWVGTLENGGTRVGIRLRVEGIRENGGRNPRQVAVRPILSDAEGKNVVQLCERCFRLHDERATRNCNCGGLTIPVKLNSEPIVQRDAHFNNLEQISESLSIAREMTGQTTIHGAFVTYTRMHWDNEQQTYIRPRNQRQVEFEAVYQDDNGDNEPLHYAIRTSGTAWDLGEITQQILMDRGLEQILSDNGKLLDANIVLHTAGHILYKAIAALSGVREQVLEYAISEHLNQVVIWERYEGGIGLSEIIRNIIREQPLQLYRELLYSVICPVHLAQEINDNGHNADTLRRDLAEQWALAYNDELLETIVDEAVAERTAVVSAQAEPNVGCADGCPACLHIGMCTDRRNQTQVVSRAVASEIMRHLLQRLNQEALDALNQERVSNGLPIAHILRYDEQQELYDVLRF